jgi:hypothetical protein
MFSSQCFRRKIRVICQHCHREVTTRPVASSDGCTVIAIIILLFTCWPLFWLPLCFSCCKKTVHYCPLCQKEVGEKRALIPIPVAAVALVAGVFIFLRFILHVHLPHFDFHNIDLPHFDYSDIHIPHPDMISIGRILIDITYSCATFIDRGTTKDSA